MTMRQKAGFFLLCLLSSATWLLTEWLPAHLPAIAGEGFRLLLVGVLGSLSPPWTGASGKVPSIGHCAAVAAASMGVLGLPFLLLVAAEGKVSSNCVVLVFAGMPILFTVVGGAFSAESDLRQLPAGAIGLGGLLILLPMQIPQGNAGALAAGMLLVAMVLTAASVLWLHRLLQAFPLRLAISLTGAVNGLLLLLAAGFSTTPALDYRAVWFEGLRGLLFDLPQVALLLWLTKAVAPMKVASRYLVAPFLTVIEGLVLLRPGFDVRTIAGLILLAGGAYLLLRPQSQRQDVSLEL